MPQVIRVRLVWSDSSGHFGSRLFFDAGAPVYAQPDLTYLATQISSLWGTNMKADVANTYALSEVDCLDLGSSTGALGLWQGTVQGTNGANELPSNCCVNIRPLIPQHYRGGHPVTHHPPASQTAVAGTRNWTGTFTNGVATHWGAFMAAITAITHGTVVAPAPVVPLGYKPGATFSNITLAQANGYLVPTKFGTMRRRLYTES